MTRYHVTLRVLSPLHIGDGNELRQDFDFVVHKERTWRLDEDAVLRAKEAQLLGSATEQYPLPGRLLNSSDFGTEALFRYVLRGQPRSRKSDARVKSCIKDVHDCVYVPGSSLKGAIRTALAWTGWDEVKPHLDRSAVGRGRSWAGQPLERKLFGRNPNHDLLRALHVSDLHGPKKAGERITLVNAQVLTRRSAGSPIELEAVAGDAEFRGTITVDETLFSPQAENKLHFGSRQHWLKELPARVQRHSAARIADLEKWYEQAENASAVARFYGKLTGINLPPDSALLQLGWGSGWDGKTFWTHLQRDAEMFETLVRDFKLHRPQRGAPARKPGDPFPRSRRTAMIKGKAAAPFGWCLLTMARR